VKAKSFGRVLRTGLSSFGSKLRSRFAALRFNPSRWLGFIALALLTAAYGSLLIGYTVVVVVMDHGPHSGWWVLYTMAIQFALLWAFFCLALFAKAVRPY
jgi:hypothetical protein